MASEYTSDNLLDRRTSRGTLEHHYALLKRREAMLARRLLRTPRAGAERASALEVGCGWWPARHLVPAAEWRLAVVDTSEDKVEVCVERGADRGLVGSAGNLDAALGEERFDVVIYRLVLHHLAYRGPLEPVVAEAARLLRPGGSLVAIEPNVWHPVGAMLAGANRLGLGVRVHGTPDDVPLSPRALAGAARTAGLDPELHAVTYSWRRLPPVAQRAVARLDRAGSAPGLRALGHTLMLVARRP